MEKKATRTLLPYVMDLLSRKRNLCLTLESLCDEIKNVVVDEHTKGFDSLEEAVEFAVKVGMDLGILAKSKNRFRVPFNFAIKKRPEAENPREYRITPAQGRRLIRNLMPDNPPKKSARSPNTRPKVVTTHAGGRRVAVRRPRGAAKK